MIEFIGYDRTFESIIMICECCPNLTSVSFRGNFGETADFVVQCLTLACPLLEKLYLRDVKEITDLSLTHISGLSRLYELDLSSIYNLTSIDLCTFIQSKPNLQVFYAAFKMIPSMMS